MAFGHSSSLAQFISVSLIAAALTACSSTPELVPPQDVDFADTTVLNVDATSVDVRFVNRPPSEYPHVGHRSPVTFERAIEDWTDKRFELTGNTASAFRITIKKNDITEELLPVETGLSGAFKKEQAAKYEARLEVAIELVDPNGEVLGSATGESWNTYTVAEDATENDKRIVWVDMITKALDGLDQELIPRIREGLTGYVK